ncbi:MAG: hypothetical protein OXG35_34300 [Acidobacteria bacterium]|nr:hypothetical protein [Acidobacteriota bacterium]
MTIDEWNTLELKLAHHARERGATDLHLRRDRVPLLRINGQLRRAEDAPRPDDWPAEILGYSRTEMRHGEHGAVRRTITTHNDSPDNRDTCVYRFPHETPEITALDLSPNLRKMLSHRHGLVVIASRPRNGRSTSLAAAIEFLTTGDGNVSPRHVANFDEHNEYPGAGEPDFRTIVVTEQRFSTKADHDAVVTDAYGDRKIIKNALRAACNGTLVVLGMHGSSFSQVLRKLLNVHGAAEREATGHDLAEALIGVMHQELVPGTEDRLRCVTDTTLTNTRLKEALRRGNLEAVSKHTPLVDGRLWNLRRLLQTEAITRETFDAYGGNRQQ